MPANPRHTPSARWARFVLAHRIELLLIAFLLYRVGHAAFQLTFEVPQARAIFNSMNVELPWLTHLLLTTSDILAAYWFLLFPILGGLVGYLVVFRPARALVRLGATANRDAADEGRAAVFLGLAAAVVATEVVHRAGVMALWYPMLRLVNNVG